MATITDTVTLEKPTQGNVGDAVRRLVHGLSVLLDTNVEMPKMGTGQDTVRISVGVQGDPSSPVIEYRRMSTETGMKDVVTVKGPENGDIVYRQLGAAFVTGALTGLGYVESRQV